MLSYVTFRPIHKPLFYQIHTDSNIHALGADDSKVENVVRVRVVVSGEECFTVFAVSKGVHVFSVFADEAVGPSV